MNKIINILKVLMNLKCFLWCTLNVATTVNLQRMQELGTMNEKCNNRITNYTNNWPSCYKSKGKIETGQAKNSDIDHITFARRMFDTLRHHGHKRRFFLQPRK